MKIPKHLKICGMDFKVRLEKAPMLNDDRPCAGYIQQDYGLIVLEEDMHPDRQGQALFHEIIHALDAREELNEGKTEALARGIYQVLKDNHLLRE